MDSAEKYLNEAQYAFTSINSGESRENRRNAARAKSLCNKIIRKFPASTEAASAHAILRRMGDEAYTSKMAVQHRHSAEHQPMRPQQQDHTDRPASQHKPMVGLNWRGLLEVIFNLPITSLVAIAAGFFVLFSFLGAFLWLPLILLVFTFGSIKKALRPEQVELVNTYIARANSYAEGKRNRRS